MPFFSRLCFFHFEKGGRAAFVTTRSSTVSYAHTRTNSSNIYLYFSAEIVALKASPGDELQRNFQLRPFTSTLHDQRKPRSSILQFRKLHIIRYEREKETEKRRKRTERSFDISLQFVNIDSYDCKLRYGVGNYSNYIGQRRVKRNVCSRCRRDYARISNAWGEKERKRKIDRGQLEKSGGTIQRHRKLAITFSLVRMSFL